MWRGGGGQGLCLTDVPRLRLSKTNSDHVTDLDAQREDTEFRQLILC